MGMCWWRRADVEPPCPSQQPTVQDRQALASYPGAPALWPSDLARRTRTGRIGDTAKRTGATASAARFWHSPVWLLLLRGLCAATIRELPVLPGASGSG